MTAGAAPLERGIRCYRWLFRLACGYLAACVLATLLLLASIDDANAGYPALFFGGLLLFTVWPVSVACAVLAAASLARREPHRGWVAAVGIVACLLAWALWRPTFAALESVLHLVT